MGRAVRFVFALAALPLAWGVARAFVDVFRLMAEGGGLVSSGAAAVFAGVLAQVLVWLALPVPARAYVLGHELTHALWGMLFGARVSRLRVGAGGGSVTLSKSNVWITLAPYFFPFYAAVVAGLACLVRLFVSPLPAPWAWLFAAGFAWSFHVCFTVRALLQRQPDVEEYGRLFSYVVIWILNVAGLAAWAVCASEVSWGAFGGRLLARTRAAYAAVGAVCAWGYESLRSLSVLQG